MAGPWEKYQTEQAPGPWDKYRASGQRIEPAPPVAPVPEPTAPDMSTPDIPLDEGEQRLINQMQQGKIDDYAAERERYEQFQNLDSVPVGGDMYDGMSFDDAVEFHKLLTQSPRFRRGNMMEPDAYLVRDAKTGEERWQVLPTPNISVLGTAGSTLRAATGQGGEPEVKAGVGIAQRLQGAVRNAGKFIGEKVGALTGNEEMYDYQEGRSEFESPGLMAETATMLAGGGAGYKAATRAIGALEAAGATSKLAATAARWADTPTKVLLTDLGFLAVTDPDAQTIIAGENSVLNQMTGLNVGVQPDDESRIAQARANTINLGLDTIAFSLGVEVATAAATLSSMVSKAVLGPVTEAVFTGSREKAVVNEFINKIASASGETDPAALQRVRQELVALVDANKDVFAQVADEQNLIYTRTVADAMIAGLDPNEPRQAAMRKALLEVQTGITQKGGGLTEFAQAEPQRRLMGQTEQMEEAFGGDAAIRESADTFYSRGTQPIRDLDADIGAKRAQVQAMETDLVEAFNSDPNLGQKLVRAEGAFYDTNAAKDAAKGSIATRVTNLYETMTTERNALFARIQSGEIDVDGLVDVLTDMTPNQLDAMRPYLAKSPLAQDLIRLVQPRQVEGGQAVDFFADQAIKTTMRPETTAEVKQRVAALLTENGYDFGTMMREWRPAIAQAANDLYMTGRSAPSAAAEQYRNLTRWMDTDATEFVGRSNPELAQAAQDALQFSREYYELWDDGGGIMSKMHDVLSSPGKRTDAVRLTQRDNLKEQTEAVFGARRQGDVKKLGDAVMRPGAADGTTGDPIVQYALADTAQELVRRTRADGLDSIEAAELFTRLEDNLFILRERDPAAAKSLTGFIERVRAAKGNVNAEREALRKMEEAFVDAKQRAIDSEFGIFMKRTSGAPARKDPYQAMSELFNGKDNAYQIEELVRIAREEDNPLVLDGMRAAYGRWMREKLFNYTPETTGPRSAKLSQMNQISEEEANKALEYGRAVYGEEGAAYMQVMEAALAGTIETLTNKRARPVSVFSPTAFATAGQASVGRITTATFGVLSNISARIRSATGGLLQYVAPDEAAKVFFDRMNANPDVFLPIAEGLVGFDQMDPTRRKILLEAIARAALYNSPETDVPANWDQIVQDAVNGAYADMEMGEAFSP